MGAYQGSFSCTSHAGFIFTWGVSLTHPILALFFCVDFLLHIPCCLHFYAGSFSYTSRAAFIFMRGVSLTHPMLASFFSLGSFLTHSARASFLSRGSLLNIPRWLRFFFSFFFCLFCFSSGEFLFHTPTCCCCCCCVLLFISGEFLMHIPRWLHFQIGSFSYTSPAGFIFIWRVSLTYRMPASFLYGEFLLHIACRLHF